MTSVVRHDANVRLRSWFPTRVGIALLGVGLLTASIGCTQDETTAATTEAPAEQPADPEPTGPDTAGPETAEAELTEAEEAAALAESIGRLSVVDGGSGKRLLISHGSNGPSSEQLSEKLIVANHGCIHATADNAAPILLLLPTSSEMKTDQGLAVKIDGTAYPIGTQMTFTGDTVTLNDEQLAQAAPCVPEGKVFRVASVSAGG